MSTVCGCHGKNGKRMRSLIADERGVASLAMPVIWSERMLSVLLRLAAVAATGFKYVAATEALRSFGGGSRSWTPSDLLGWASGSSLSHARTKAAVDSPCPSSNAQVF